MPTSNERKMLSSNEALQELKRTFLFINQETEGFRQLEIIIDVLVDAFCFI